MKLFGFGDSFTEGHPEYFIKGHKAFEEWKNFRNGQLPPSWIELLGSKLNRNVVNYGQSGNGNQEIFEKFCIHSGEIMKDDIVIINWSYKTRFRWACHEVNPNYKIKDYGWTNNDREVLWVRTGPGDVYMNYAHLCISQNAKDEIVVNRSKQNYSDEVYNYETLVEEYANAKRFHVFFWSVDDDLINRLPLEIREKKKYICAEQINRDMTYKIHNTVYYGELLQEVIKRGGETIEMETQNEITDYHLGEMGHRIQFEMFYDYLINYI